MRTVHIVAGLVVALSIVSTPVQAQKATEFYLPIGQSPGLSNQYTWQGTVETVDMANMTVTVKNDTGSRTISLDADSKIWLDKSGVKMTNETGDTDDCKPGVYVEVKYRDNDPSNKAEWIKIRIES